MSDWYDEAKAEMLNEVSEQTGVPAEQGDKVFEALIKFGFINQHQARDILGDQW